MRKISIKRELAELKLWLETQWKEIDRDTKRSLRLKLEHRLMLGIANKAIAKQTSEIVAMLRKAKV